jgi:hypothetical protein
MYDCTNIRQVIEQTFTTIDYLASVVKIRGCTDPKKVEDMLKAIYGQDGVAKIKKFSEMRQFEPTGDEARRNNEIFKSLNACFSPKYFAELILPDCSTKISSAE